MGTGRVVATIAVGQTPYAVAVSPTGDVYVTNEAGGMVSVIDPTNTVSPPGSNTVSVINPANDAVINTIAVGGFPAGVAGNPTGPNAGDIYIAEAGNAIVSVIR
jgi:YVTN family beta-propeller protein